MAALLVVVVVGGYRSLHGVVAGLGTPSCRAVALAQPVTLTPEQMANAATITAVAVRRGLPARAATIALATAVQESKLRNLTYGDKDSLGLFQQRTSQGWGTKEQVLDPVHASNAFYDAMVKVRDYQTLPITKVAQKVQRSAFPAAYAQHEQQARVLASALSGLSPGGLGCRLDAAESRGDPAALERSLRMELGRPASVRGSTVSVETGVAQLAWTCGAWAVAHADAYRITSVTVGDRSWSRSGEKSAWSWQPAQGSASSTTVRIVLA